MLEDTLRACVLDHKGSWEEHFPLVEFAYNNSYQASIRMAPYEALYRRPCRSPLCWTEVGEIEVDTDGTFEEGPVCILDSRDQVLRRKTVRIVRVLWQHCGVEESTWEREDTMWATYPFLFRDEGTWFSRLIFK